MSNDKRARSVFSERLRMLRKSNNLTQKQVAQSLSIYRSTYASVDLTQEELAFLNIYRQLDSIQRNAVMQFALEQRFQRQSFSDR